MSNPGINMIRLPAISRRWHGESLARQVLLKLFGGLQRGRLTIHEGEATRHFHGSDTCREDIDAVIVVENPLVYRRVLSGGVLAAGEAYMLGQWHSPDLVAVIRLFCANIATMDSMDSSASPLRQAGLKLYHAFKKNSLKGSQENISAHYDLGNDFFELFLDKSMMYSAAVFPRPDASLEEASLYKLDLLCRQLQLSEADHLLEIGTGWGGLAIHAARHYGCRVTTTTISREQYEYACNRVEQEGLGDRVTLLCEDYRKLTGHYDKLVSVEMIEAVGHNYYQDYFSRCNSLLKPDGLMAIQAITVADQRYLKARDSVDFIKRYIFPGGCLPSMEVIAGHLAKDTDMQLVHLHDITDDYAQTLAHWRERFFQSLGQVHEQGFDDVFERMWEFYLCYCEGGFRERVISTVQLTFAGPDYRFNR